MTSVSIREAKARLSSLVDEAAKGNVVRITRYGKPVAAIVSLDVTKAAQSFDPKPEPLLSTFLSTFPVFDFVVERNRTRSRDVDF